MGNLRRLAILVILGILLPAVSCIPWRDREDPWPRDRPRTVSLEVRNQHFNEVVVYLMPDGVRQRLGTVTGVSTQMFDLPTPVAERPGGLRFMVSPIGSRETYRTETIVPSPGDIIVLTATSRLRMSHWHIR